MTEGFVGIGPTGNIASKQQRIEEISKGPNPNAPGGATVVEQRTRIYGDLAVTTRQSKTANGGNRQTIIHAKQGGKWQRAGIITT